jgi:hypothetical protein
MLERDEVGVGEIDGDSDEQHGLDRWVRTVYVGKPSGVSNALPFDRHTI